MRFIIAVIEVHIFVCVSAGYTVSQSSLYSQKYSGSFFVRKILMTTALCAAAVPCPQVSKAAPTGEYLPTGSFMIRGKKNFLPPQGLVMGFGFMFKLEESCIGRHAGERAVRGAAEDWDQQQQQQQRSSATEDDEENDEQQSESGVRHLSVRCFAATEQWFSSHMLDILVFDTWHSLEWCAAWCTCLFPVTELVMLLLCPTAVSIR